MNRYQMIDSLIQFLANYRLYLPGNKGQMGNLINNLNRTADVQSPEDVLRKVRELNLLSGVRISDAEILGKWQELVQSSTQSMTRHQSVPPTAPSLVDPDIALVAKSLGEHRKVVKKIGEGGMGIVLLINNHVLSRREVVKIMKGGGQEDFARFHKEAQAMAQVSHPNVVQILEVGMNTLNPFLVLEFVEGETLKARLKREERMVTEEALKLLRPAIAGVHTLHERGIIHRDLKPENLMIRAENGDLVVLDLGLAKRNGGREQAVNLDSVQLNQQGVAMTQTGDILGTPKFMAPEQASGAEVTPATDVWAFGVILYKMLTGEHLNEGQTTIDILSRLFSTDFEQLATDRLTELGVTPFCVSLVASCVRTEASERPQSCADLLSIIDGHFARVEEERVASVEREIAAQQLVAAKQKRITQLLWAGVGMALLSIGLVLFFAKAKSEAEKRESAEAKARAAAVTRAEAQAQAAQEAEEREKLAEKAKKASAQVEEANQLIANGQWEEAKMLLVGVVEDFPDQRNARRLLVEVCDVLADPLRIEHSRWLAQTSSGPARQNYLLRAVMGVDTMDDTSVDAVNRQLEVADEIIADMEEGLHLNLAKVMRDLFAANRLAVQGKTREGYQAQMQALRKVGDYANVSHESWETRFVLGLFQVLSSQFAWAMEPNMQAPSLGRLDIYMRGWSRSFETINEAARANPDYHMTLYFRQLCRRELARLTRLDTRLSQERRTLLALAELAPAFQDLDRLQVMRPGSPAETLGAADCALELAFPEVFNKKKRLLYLRRAKQLLAECEQKLVEEEYKPMAEMVYLVSAKAQALEWQLTESADARSRARAYLDQARLEKKDGEHDAIYLTVTEMIE